MFSLGSSKLLGSSSVKGLVLMDHLLMEKGFWRNSCKTPVMSDGQVILHKCVIHFSVVPDPL